MENLSDSQREAVLLFEEITQITDHQLCISILAQNTWSVDMAVDNFIQGRTNTLTSRGSRNSLSTVNDSSPTLSSSSSSSSSSLSASQSQSTPPLGTTDSRVAVQSSHGGPIDFILSPFKWIFQTKVPAINPDFDAQKFTAEFEQLYSPQHPRFHDSSYQSAASIAFRESKLLLIYLHSPMHEDTARFCSQTLCTTSFSSFVDRNMVTWAGKVWDTEAYGLSIQLKVSAFPFIAILLCQSDRAVQVLDRIQGYTDEEQLTERIQNTITANSAAITRVHTETARRTEYSQLREQQDREYREAEEADRRERQRRESEALEKARLEEEEQQRQELQAAIELSNKLSRESAMLCRRQELGEEPPSNATDAATIRFQLPTGNKISRRFIKSDTVQKIHDYLLLYFFDQAAEIHAISIATHFPKVELTDMTQTIADAGLFPRGMLYVQNLDA